MSVAIILVLSIIIIGCSYKLGNLRGYVSGYRRAIDFNKKQKVKDHINKFYDEYYSYAFKILTDPKCKAPIAIYLETLAHYEELEEFEKCVELKQIMDEIAEKEIRDQLNEEQSSQGELF